MPGQTRHPQSGSSSTSTAGSTASVAGGSTDLGSNSDASAQLGGPGAGSTTPTLDAAGGLGSAGQLGSAAADEPSFFEDLYQRGVNGLVRINHAIQDADPDAFLESFLDTVGEKMEQFIVATDPLGSYKLALLRWSDHFLQGHGKMDFGKVEYGDTGGKHVDEETGGMGPSDKAKIWFDDTKLPGFGGLGGFESMDETKRLSDIVKNLQGLYENIDKALDYAEELGLLGEPETVHSNGTDPIESTTTVTTTDAADGDGTDQGTLDPNLTVHQEDGSGDLSTSKHGNFAVNADGTVDNGPTTFDAKDDKTKTDTKSDKTKVDKTKTDKGGSSAPLTVDVEKVATTADWKPPTLDYEYYTTDLTNNWDSPRQDLIYWVYVYKYPDGSYDIVASYTYNVPDVPTQRGDKLLRHCKPGTPPPKGLEMSLYG